MRSFGVILLREDSEQTYIDELAKISKSYGYSFYKFIPSKINPYTQLITGHQFNDEHQRWEESKFPIPEILYDRCFYINEKEVKEYSPIIQWLKSRKDLTFLAHGLPNKLEVYEAIKTSPTLQPYLPETVRVTSVVDIKKYITKKERFILKPLFGSQGRGIYFIEPAKDYFIIKTIKQSEMIEKQLPVKKAIHWIQQLLNNFSYIVQPYLSLINTDYQPFDIRVFLQKDEHGLWVERARSFRVGQKGSFVSNLSAGGEISSYSDGLKQLRYDLRNFITEEINEIIRCLPTALEEHFPSLFELGIDIGVDQKGAVWLLEVNSKPGRKSVIEVAPEQKEKLIQAPFLYANHILNLQLKSGGITT